MNKIERAWKHGTDWKWPGGRGIMVQRREGTRWRTCMNDPRTWTTAWGLTVGVGSGMDGVGQRGKIGTTLID